MVGSSSSSRSRRHHQRARQVQAHAPAAGERPTPRAACVSAGKPRPCSSLPARARGVVAVDLVQPVVRLGDGIPVFGGHGRGFGLQDRVHLGVAGQHEIDRRIGQRRRFLGHAGDAQPCRACRRSPWSASISPRIAANRLDLPQPLRPITPTRQPACRVRSTSDSSRRSPRRRAKFRKAIIARPFVQARRRLAAAMLSDLHRLTPPCDTAVRPATETRCRTTHPLIALLAVGFVLAFVLGSARAPAAAVAAGRLPAGRRGRRAVHARASSATRTLAPQLAEIGVILLMFGVGLHFSLDDLLAVTQDRDSRRDRADRLRHGAGLGPGLVPRLDARGRASCSAWRCRWPAPWC